MMTISFLTDEGQKFSAGIKNTFKRQFTC